MMNFTIPPELDSGLKKQPRFIWNLVGRAEKLRNLGTTAEKTIESGLPAEDPQ